MESGSLSPTCGCASAGADCDGEAAKPLANHLLLLCGQIAMPGVELGEFCAAAKPTLLKIAAVIAPARMS
jgi:hypothetical protein